MIKKSYSVSSRGSVISSVVIMTARILFMKYAEIQSPSWSFVMVSWDENAIMAKYSAIACMIPVEILRTNISAIKSIK